MAEGEKLTSTLTIVDEASKVLDAISASAVGASSSLDKVIGHLGEVSAVKSPNIGIGGIAKNIVPPMNAGDVGRRADEVSRQIKGIGDASEQAHGRSQSAFSRMAADIAHVTQAANGVSAAISKIGSMSVAAITKGDDIAKTSRALHMNAQAYQELDYAARRGGATHDGFVQSLKTLDRQLAQLNGGSKEVAKAFGQIGLSQKDLAGKDLEGSLYAISDALNSMEDKGNAAKAAATLLGIQGYKTASAFSVGAENLDRLREEARETGTIMDGMTLDLAEHGADELLNVQLHIQSIWQRISISIMPTVVKVLERIDALFKENAGVINRIAAFAGQLADEALPVIMMLTEIIMRNMQRVFEFISPYMSHIMDFVGAVADGIGILVDQFGDVILAIGGVVTALCVVKAVLLAISANPVMAIIAGTVAIIALIEGMRKKSEEFYEVTEKIGIGLATGVFTAAHAAVGAFQTAGNAIGRVWYAITGAVMKSFGATLGWLAEKWNAFMEWIGFDSLSVDASFANDIEQSGSGRLDDATDTSKDFYFDASGSFEEMSRAIEHGMSMMGKTGSELGWKEPAADILEKLDEQTRQDTKNNNKIMGTLNSGVKIDKDSILFMKEMATAEIINRYNNISPTITQSFSSNSPFEPGQIETLSGKAIDGAMAGMRAAI